MDTAVNPLKTSPMAGDCDIDVAGCKRWMASRWYASDVGLKSTTRKNPDVSTSKTMPNGLCASYAMMVLSVDNTFPVSYTHLTLPTIYSV